MLQRIHKWSQHLLLHQWWTTKCIWELELLLHFLYDTMKEDDMDYPAQLTWIDRVSTEPDMDTYACRLLFLLMCSKRVKDKSLTSLDIFVNDKQFSLMQIINMGEEGLKYSILALATRIPLSCSCCSKM